MTFCIKEIKYYDNQKVAEIIRLVGKEFDAIGVGFGSADAEVSHMSQHYNYANNSCYFIAINHGQVVGGSGIAMYNGSSEICELRKLFLLPESRGLGIGEALLVRCLAFAKSRQFSKCYLDTLSTMKAAISLYEKFSFKQLDSPMEGTEHNGCDTWMIKKL